MSLDFEEILETNNYNRKRDHLVTNCPFCGKDDHFYFNIKKAEQQREGKYVNCFDCKKCKRVGNLESLLGKLGKLNLLKGKFLDSDFLKNRLKPEEEQSIASPTLPEIKPPTGFKRTFDNEYLKERGFTQLEFNKYTVGVSILNKYKDYVFILVIINGKIVGYVGRSILKKEEIKKINAEYKKQGSKKKYLRYQNSAGTNFSKTLLGSEEIIFTTTWMILVEGYFDKVRLDQALSLDTIPEMKCGCTWGKSISEDQILIMKKKGIRGVILIQDPDAVNDSKNIAFELKKHFDNVLVGYTGETDLGGSTDEEILRVFNSIKSPLNFKLSIIQKNILV